MKKIYFLLTSIIIVFFAGLLSSCDYLLPAPLGRNNPFDDEAQIGRFSVAVSGSDSMVTNWDWHDALSTIEDKRVIDRIRIVHQKNSRPTSRNPLNPDNVQEFTSTSNWFYNWTGLKNDKDHHFALYAHEKSGLWLSPKYIETYLDSSVQDNNYTLNSDDLLGSKDPEEFKVYKVGETPYTVTDVSNMSVPGFVAGDYAILEFDVNDTIYFDQFLLHVSNINTPATDEDLTIYAIKKDSQSITDWADLISDSTIDYEFSLSMQVTVSGGSFQSIDISEIANRMSLYYSHAIAIYVNNAFDVDVSQWTIDTHFWGNNY